MRLIGHLIKKKTVVIRRLSLYDAICSMKRSIECSLVLKSARKKTYEEMNAELRSISEV